MDRIGKDLEQTVSDAEPRPRRARHVAARRDHRAGRAHADGVDGGGRVHPADRLHQRDQPAAGEGGGTPPRDGGALGDRRRASTVDPPGAGRMRRDGDRRRRGRPDARGVDACSLLATQVPAVARPGRRRGLQRAGLVVHDRRVRADGPARRRAAGVAPGARRSRGATQGRRPQSGQHEARRCASVSSSRRSR